MKQVAIRAWGNSQGIVLPKELMNELGLKVSDVLELEIEDQSIILRKSYKHKKFEERLEAYGGAISTIQYDWGTPKGRELL